MKVNKQRHSDRFVEEMARHHCVQYYTVPGRGHCDLSEEMWEKYNCCITAAIENHKA